MAERHSETVVVTCPRCGVNYNRRPRTVEKYLALGKSEWDATICADCKPTWIRKERVTNDEIWAEYCKANGLVA